MSYNSHDPYNLYPHYKKPHIVKNEKHGVNFKSPILSLASTRKSLLQGLKIFQFY